MSESMSASVTLIILRARVCLCAYMCVNIYIESVLFTLWFALIFCSSSAQTELAVCMDLKYGRKTLGVLKNKTLIGIKMS